MEIKKIKINSTFHKGEMLDGTIFFPKSLKDKNPAVFFIHGWLSSEDGYISRAKVLTKLGYICLTFNLPGHKNSKRDINKITGQEFLDSVVNVYDYLKKIKTVDSKKIGVVGASFGGYLGPLLTKKRFIRWLVLRAPANYKDEGFKNIPQIKYKYEYPKTKQWREKVLNYNESETLNSLHEYPNDILIVESEKDVVVPHQSVQNYVNASSNPLKLTHLVIEGADHPLSEDKYKREFIQILINWFKERI